MSGESSRHSRLGPMGGPKFSPSRTQKLSGNPRCGLFAVRHRLRTGLTGKRFVSRLSWLSSSRPPFTSAVPGPWDFGPVRLVTEIGSPHASRVARASQRSPRGRDSHPLRANTAFVQKACPCRPRSSGAIHRIERPVCAPRFVREVFGRASLRRTGRAPLDAPSSTGEALG